MLLKSDPSSILFIVPPFLLTLSTQVQQVCLIDVIKYKSFRKKERGKFNIFLTAWNIKRERQESSFPRPGADLVDVGLRSRGAGISEGSLTGTACRNTGIPR